MKVWFLIFILVAASAYAVDFDMAYHTLQQIVSNGKSIDANNNGIVDEANIARRAEWKNIDWGNANYQRVCRTPDSYVTGFNENGVKCAKISISPSGIIKTDSLGIGSYDPEPFFRPFDVSSNNGVVWATLENNLIKIECDSSSCGLASDFVPIWIPYGLRQVAVSDSIYVGSEAGRVFKVYETQTGFECDYFEYDGSGNKLRKAKGVAANDNYIYTIDSVTRTLNRYTKELYADGSIILPYEPSRILVGENVVVQMNLENGTTFFDKFDYDLNFIGREEDEAVSFTLRNEAGSFESNEVIDVMNVENNNLLFNNEEILGLSSAKNVHYVHYEEGVFREGAYWFSTTDEIIVMLGTGNINIAFDAPYKPLNCNENQLWTGTWRDTGLGKQIDDDECTNFKEGGVCYKPRVCYKFDKQYECGQ